MSGPNNPTPTSPPALSADIAGLLARTAVVVATHWRRPLDGRWPGANVRHEDAVLSQEGLMTRFLSSLEGLSDRPRVVIILVTSTEPGAETAAIWNADRARARFSLPIALWTPIHVRSLHGLLGALGHEEWIRWFDVRGYPQIRNMQLLVPYLLDCDLVVTLDDDEVVEDPFFLRRAVAGVVHGDSKGDRVWGAAGYYLDEHGSRMHEVGAAAAADPNPFARKMALMNGILNRIDNEPGTIVQAHFALGGNMTFSRSLIAQVGFDPAIARGEDVDYVINAALMGIPYHFDKSRLVRHLPPAGRSYKDFAYTKLQQDVRRFIYEREKLRVAAADGGFAPLDAADLKPYPGDMLCDDLEQHAIAALRLHRPAASDGEMLDPEAFVAQACDTGRRSAQAFRHFARTWPQALEVLAGDRAVRHVARTILW
jgi:hypothetical protein